jgi:ABC-type nitrate/sulfonate/bicarbonate transport system substrate-binding protein
MLNQNPASKPATSRLLRLRGIGAILAALILFLIAACGGSASSASTKPTVTIGVYGGNLLPAEVAVAKGYFAKQGINVQLKTLAAGPAIASAATTGSVDIGFGDTLAWAAAVTNGFSNLMLIQGGDISLPTLKSDEHIVARQGITSPRQLAGKTIGTIPYPEMNVATRLWLQQNGVNPATVRFISIQDGTQGALLRTGGADAVEGRNVGEDKQLVAQDHATDFGEVFGAQPNNSISTASFASRQWLENNKATAAKVVTALRQATDYIRTAPSQDLAALATRYAGISYPALEKQYPGIVAETSWAREQPAVFTPTAIAATNTWIQDAVRVGQLKKPVDVSKYLWPTATETTPR